MASSRKPDPGVALKVGLLDAAAALAESAGAKGPFLLTPLPGGTNNQVYRLDGTRFSGLLKAYYAGPGDRRDRLGVEFGFCRVAWSSGVKAVPRPLAMDPRRRLGLYEFIEGRPPRPGSGPPRPAQADLGQALRFLLALNAPRVRRAAGALPPASDACFSLARHLDCVDRRLSALSAARASSPVEKRARRFVRKELAPAWRAARAGILEDAAHIGWKPAAVLAPRERWLSPSDFGFHNALAVKGGRLRFIDLEYGGWDDPAKAVCDLFSLGAARVPGRYFEPFARAVAARTKEPERSFARMKAVWPAHRFKWCCLLLNDFVPSAGRRRRFSQGAAGEERKKVQLEKAKAALQEII